MRRPVAHLLLAAILSTLAGAGFAADDAALEIAAKLAARNGMIDVDELARKMTEYQLERQPALKPYRRVMVEFFAEFFNSAEVHREMAVVYAEHFTLEELRELEALMRNPLLAKFQRLTPELLPQMLAATEPLLFSQVDELEARIAAEAERLDSEPDPASAD